MIEYAGVRVTSSLEDQSSEHEPEFCTLCERSPISVALRHTNREDRRVASPSLLGLCPACLGLFHERRLIELSIRMMASAQRWDASQEDLVLFLLDMNAEVHDQYPAAFEFAPADDEDS